MCDVCTAKARKNSELAGFFRQNADETSFVYYINRMNEAAVFLEDLAQYFSAGCRCGEDQERHIAGIIARAGHPLFAAPGNAPFRVATSGLEARPANR